MSDAESEEYQGKSGVEDKASRSAGPRLKRDCLNTRVPAILTKQTLNYLRLLGFI